MELGDRKKKILRAIVEGYIATGEPVGSKTLLQETGISVSPATVRNDMADLTQNGFLYQPHTSAGRIPTQKACRYYIDNLMTPKAPSARIYFVQKGDTLWGIAEKFYGKGQGSRFSQIMSANNLMDTLIHPGQVLIIPDGDPSTVYRTIQITIEQDTLELLTIMAEGWGKTIGQVVDKLMEDAK